MVGVSVFVCLYTSVTFFSCLSPCLCLSQSLCISLCLSVRLLCSVSECASVSALSFHVLPSSSVMAVEACIRLEQTRALARRSCVLLLLLQQEKRRVRGGGGMKVGWNGTMPCTWYFKRRIPSEPTLLLQSTDNDNRFDFCTHALSLSRLLPLSFSLADSISPSISLPALSAIYSARYCVCSRTTTTYLQPPPAHSRGRSVKSTRVTSNGQYVSSGKVSTCQAHRIPYATI